MKYADLLTNSDDFNLKSSPAKEAFAEIRNIISDDSYFNFIENVNGGFFYDYSLQLYSYGSPFEFHDILKVNETIKKEYKSNIIGDAIFFGQDIFGNQFGYSGGAIIFFNAETGDREKIADNFDDWIEKLYSDLDYLTGRNIVKSWLNFNSSFNVGERLCPKKPFIIGGAYKVENLFPLAYPGYIAAYANIANQIFDLPNGTQIKLKIAE